MEGLDRAARSGTLPPVAACKKAGRILGAARRIYERAGFTLTSQAPHHAFGHDLVEQTWSLSL